MFRASIICAVLLCAAVSAAPKRKHTPEWRESVAATGVRQSEDHIPQVRHHTAKHTAETAEALVVKHEEIAEKIEKLAETFEKLAEKYEEKAEKYEKPAVKPELVAEKPELPVEKPVEEPQLPVLLPVEKPELPVEKPELSAEKPAEKQEAQLEKTEEKKDETVLLRHHTVKHEGHTHEHPKETTEQQLAQPSPTQETVKEETQEIVKEEIQETVKEETVKAETVSEEEQKPQPEKVLEVSNALPLKLEEETLAVKSYLVHPKLTVQETIKEFQAVESPKIPLVSLSQVKDDLKSENELEEQDSKPVQQDETKPEEQTEQKEEEQTESKEEENKSEDEVRVLSPVLTLPKDENKDSWSIVVKQITPDKEEEIIAITKASEDQIQETKLEEQKVEEQKVEQKVEEQKYEVPAVDSAALVKDEVAPLSNELYTEEKPQTHSEEQIKVKVVYDKPEKVHVKDIKEDIIKDFTNAIKGQVDQVQYDLLSSKHKFEERFQAVREGIKEKQEFIKDAVQQNKDKVNDFIDKFIFKINNTVTVPPPTEVPNPTEPTEDPNVPPPGPADRSSGLAEETKPSEESVQSEEAVPEKLEEAEALPLIAEDQAAKPEETVLKTEETELDGEGRQSVPVESENEKDVNDEKQSDNTFVQQAQQAFQNFQNNVQTNLQNFQNQFIQNGGSNTGAGLTEGVKPPADGPNFIQQVIQNFQQFRPPTQGGATGGSASSDLSDGQQAEVEGQQPSGQNPFQQLGQVVQNGIQNFQTNVQGGFQNVQSAIQQQQEIGAGAEGGPVNPQNILQQIGTAFQNTVQNAQNAFSPSQSGSAVADTQTENRPNIIQQGITNFQDNIVKPVQQLFQQSQLQQQTAQKPIVEPADVPVLQGSSQESSEEIDDQENSVELNTVRKHLKTGNKVEKVDQYVRNAPKVEKETETEEKPDTTSAETPEVTVSEKLDTSVIVEKLPEENLVGVEKQELITGNIVEKVDTFIRSAQASAEKEESSDDKKIEEAPKDDKKDEEKEILEVKIPSEEPQEPKKVVLEVYEKSETIEPVGSVQVTDL